MRLIAPSHLLVWHDETFSLVRIFGYDQSEIQSSLFSGRILSPADLLQFQRPNAAHGWIDTLTALSSHPEHAPLYYLLARLATDLPIDPVTAVRSVSAVFGALLIPAVYWLMRELFGRGLTPWIGAALVACSPIELLYAQEARQYALWLLLFVTSSAALARAIRSDTRPAWTLYGLLLVLGAYTHLLFLLTIPIHAGYGLYRSLRSEPTRAPFQRLARRWLLSVTAALLAFTPWLWVIVSQHAQVEHVTAWMQRPVGPMDSLVAWARHLTETFVDLSPAPSPLWLVLLIPIAWMAAHFVRRAPRAGVILLALTVLTYAAITLAPDLILGGSRSRHARYVLPALLTVELMAAWTIGAALGGKRISLGYPLGLGALATLTALGLASQIAILRADTWSSKNFSAQNIEVARLANAGAEPLVLASPSTVATGELLSLAYHLDPKVRIWGEPPAGEIRPPTDADVIIALTPSDRLRAALERQGTLTRAADTWQWLQLERTAPSAREQHAKTPASR